MRRRVGEGDHRDPVVPKKVGERLPTDADQRSQVGDDNFDRVEKPGAQSTSVEDPAVNNALANGIGRFAVAAAKKAARKGAQKVFPNLLPERYAREVADARRLGVRPLRGTDPDFDRTINQGTIKLVVTEDEELLICPHTVGGVEISHAILSGGRGVLFAGQAEIVGEKGGYIGLDLNRHSGHFEPDDASLAIARRAFAKLGIEFPGGA